LLHDFRLTSNSETPSYDVISGNESTKLQIILPKYMIQIESTSFKSKVRTILELCGCVCGIALRCCFLLSLSFAARGPAAQGIILWPLYPALTPSARKRALGHAGLTSRRA
jgi:hypothetical protein